MFDWDDGALAAGLFLASIAVAAWAGLLVRIALMAAGLE